MPSQIPASTMNNAAAPAHTDTSPAAVANRTQPGGHPRPGARSSPGARCGRRRSPALADPGRRRAWPS